MSQSPAKDETRKTFDYSKLWTATLVLGVVFLVVQIYSVYTERQKFNYDSESYITSLQQNYQRDLLDCVQNADTANKNLKKGERKITRDDCVKSVNQGRYASLLKDHGYDMLLQPESATQQGPASGQDSQ